jgi:indolepyruvate ferredoxin oxidoreductase
MAAHLEGKAVTALDMAGLAQKNGAVMSCLRFGLGARDLHAPRIGPAGADAILGCDVVVTAGRDALSKAVAGRTRAVVNVAGTPTAEFTRNADWSMPLVEMESAIEAAVGEGGASFVDATRLATGLTGDAIAANMFMLGFAWQRGLLPVGAAAIERAIELNEVAVEQNRAAFAWGRRAAADPARVEELVAPPGAVPVSRRLSASLDEAVARRVDELTDYHDEAYARRYLALVDRVREAERRLAGPQAQLQLTEAVARGLFKLMAYKDEYEVARLYTRSDFLERVNAQFEGDWTLRFHLAPPLFAKRDAQGRLVKREYGPWMMRGFRVLAAMRRVRGTWLDPFGRTEERRTERRLVAEYEDRITSLLARLTRDNLTTAIEIAALPDRIRGFGHVKAASLEEAMQRERELLAHFERAGAPVAMAAR